MWLALDRALGRELAVLGLSAALEDTFGTLAVRVASETHTGTYLELRLEDARLRIVLAPYDAGTSGAGGKRGHDA